MNNVEKIKAELKRIMEACHDENGNPITYGEDCAYARLCELKEYIDSLQEEPISGNIDFEQELYKAFGQIKDFTLGMRIAKWFYDMGKNSQKPVSEEKDIFDNCLKGEEKFILPQKMSNNINCENCPYSSACALGDIQACIIDEPVSEKLEEAAEEYSFNVPTQCEADIVWKNETEKHFIDGANWQKAQLLAGDAIKEVKGSFGGEIKVDLYAKLDNGGYIDFDPSMKLNPACGVKIGNRVRIIVMED